MAPARTPRSRSVTCGRWRDFSASPTAPRNTCRVRSREPRQTSLVTFEDHFSGHAAAYAAYRPPRRPAGARDRRPLLAGGPALGGRGVPDPPVPLRRAAGAPLRAPRALAARPVRRLPAHLVGGPAPPGGDGRGPGRGPPPR